MNSRARLQNGGFTLLEVLVALSIMAVTVAAGMHSSGALTLLAQRQSDQWLAQLCAENTLTRVRLMGQMLPLGTSQEPCEQAGRVYTVRLNVFPTPNPSFQRVKVAVSSTVPDEEGERLQLSTIVGRY